MSYSDTDIDGMAMRIVVFAVTVAALFGFALAFAR